MMRIRTSTRASGMTRMSDEWRMSPVEVITSVARRRRWSAEQKQAIVQEAEQPGMSVSAVARRYDIHPGQRTKRGQAPFLLPHAREKSRVLQ